ncbi:MAG TPA: DUF2161 family putative PD-(D/E)XK-type phosphodiesterase [Thermoclostridium sp.]|nr:DUF2161 family putative PD-(D/E)XK-type phosphodiesterase [Thermoclostridium sp.]
MAKNKKLMESELYNPVRTYFENLGFTVNAEVMNCDVTATREDLLVIIEMKTSLNLEVILQAVQRQKLAPLVYIAVPNKSSLLFTSRWKNLCHLLRRLELGLLLVTIKKGYSSVDEIIEPVVFNRNKSYSSANRKRKALLNEIHERSGDYNIGGSNRKKILTAYRESAIKMAAVLVLHGPCKVKFIREMAGLADKSGRILIDNHYGWFKREQHGVYSLSKKALKDLEEFSELFEYYKKHYS